MSANTVIEKINAKAKNEVEKLLSESKESAKLLEEGIIKIAKEKAEEIINSAKTDVDDYRDTQNLNANLEERKNNLSIRRDIIKQAYNIALNELNNMDDKTLLSFSKSVILKNCMCGNVNILVSKKYFERYNLILNSELKELSNKLSEKFNQACSLTLKPSEFDQMGFILEGEKFDIDTRFDNIVENIKQTTEKQISDILFNVKEQNKNAKK